MNQEPRIAELTRETRETKVRAKVNLDGSGESNVSTGIGFLDHMLTALSRHGGFDLELTCLGDLGVDCHHTAEDCAMVLGRAVSTALGDRLGIRRFGSAFVPMDEALARVAIDLSGRPWPVVNLDLRREMLGSIATENIVHVFNTLAIELGASIHVDVLRGKNDHHKAEAAFKALALSLRQAFARTEDLRAPSTKGVL
tara:strand:+ start:602 stop:1195 length:594 start_codon:yes stop_codon:yes gene_type:complete